MREVTAPIIPLAWARRRRTIAELRLRLARLGTLSEQDAAERELIRQQLDVIEELNDALEPEPPPGA